jgi:hypothetical protein
MRYPPRPQYNNGALRV